MPSIPEPLCVICQRRPVDPAFRPFCSERCRVIDLSRWADGSYRVPGDPVDPESLPDTDPADRS